MIPGGREAEYVDIMGAGEFLGIVTPIPGDSDPVRTQKRQLNRIYQMVFRNTIPYVKKGKRLFFHLPTLREWMRTGAHECHQSTSQPPQPKFSRSAHSYE